MLRALNRLIAAGIGLALPLSAQELRTPPDEPDEAPPRFEVIVPSDLRVASCGVKEVRVDYPLPVVRSACRTAPRVVCDPPPGSLFPVGVTRVVCSVSTDCGEQESRIFTVSVVEDAQPPGLSCPGPVRVYSQDGLGVAVEYPLPEVREDADEALQVRYDPPSGAVFPLGETVVICTATDACGKTGQCRFVVTVERARLEVQAEVVPDPTGGPARRVLTVRPGGFERVEAAASLDGDWEILDAGAVQASLDRAGSRFFRPPTQLGVTKAPQGEVAYVEVGLLAAYANPGVNPARISNDASNDFATEVLSGTSGGSGANAWSAPLQLPFTFHFFGRPYRKVRVSKNGLVTFSTNMVSGREGLGYFDFAPGDTTNRFNHRLPLWNRGFPVDNTIFGFAGRHISQGVGDGVWARVHGAAPRRQVWFVFRHAKDVQGRTTTAVVLEETSNRVLLMDMDTDNPGTTNNWMHVGIQGALNSTREVRQVLASPAVQLASSGGGLADNGCYLFRPYVLQGPVNGQGAASLQSTTNLDLLITERMRAFNLPGITVAVSRHGRLIFNKGYGFANVELGETMKPYHRACIGSVSKVLAAIGVEKLIQDKKLGGLGDWAYASDRLGKPWFWDGVNEGIALNIHTNFGNATVLNVLSNITLRHLLSHTAALGTRNDDAGAAKAYAGDDYTQLTPQQQVRWFMARQPLLTNAVARLRRYSNPSFKQIGVLIEEVAGQKFESWMLTRILAPAGVTQARLMRVEASDETWRDARRYSSYEAGNPWVTSRIDGAFGPAPYGDAIYANAADGAAGSWTATAADLVRLMAALDHLPNHADLLESARITELESVAFPSVSTTQGIGWDRVSTANRFVEKNGNIGYGSAHLIGSTTPDRLTVAVVANSGTTDANGNTVVTQLARDLRTAILPLPDVSPFYDLFPAQKLDLAP